MGAGGLATAVVEPGAVGGAARFDLVFVESVGAGCAERRVPLLVGWSTRFEGVTPVRSFPSYRGQRSFSGWWWAATSGDHVGFESWLERDQVMALDFDPEVVALASQPFWLCWSDEQGRGRRHAPDYFVRLADGNAAVIDVRADDRIEPRDAEAFAAAADACELVGWEYRRVGALDPVCAANLRWLAGYRHPRCWDERYARELQAVFAEPTELLAGADAVGERISVLPVLFHLLWTHALVTDLRASPLSANSAVIAAASAR